MKAVILPPNGTYKAVEDDAKKVQTTLNQWRHQYDIYHLDSQFRAGLNGTILCLLVYLVEKPKTAVQRPGQNLTKAAQDLSVPASSGTGQTPDSAKDGEDDDPF